jgi:anti-sigma regulatory factor (Ser/Thr protein kinase)
MTGLPGQTSSGPVGDVNLPLGTDLGTPGKARQKTRAVLVGWRLPELVDGVCLAVSELVTNAVKHGRPPVALRLRRRSNLVRIDVHDDNPAEPRLPPKTANDEATSGRGLAIVAALADEVGCEQVPNDGKIVYAEFSANRPASPEQARAPAAPRHPR